MNVIILKYVIKIKNNLFIFQIYYFIIIIIFNLLCNNLNYLYDCNNYNNF